jgi:nitrate reductase gamma subunit
MPDNAVFYHLAYAAATAIYVGYALLLIGRRNKARQRQKSS